MVARSGIVCREVCLRRSERSLTNTLHIFEILQEEAARTHASLREVAETLGAYVNRTRLPPVRIGMCNAWKATHRRCRS